MAKTTHNGDDECNPHQEVEATEHIVQGLLPVVSRRRRNHILPELRPSRYGGAVEADLNRRGKSVEYFIDGYGVSINIPDSIGRVPIFLG